MGLKDAVRVGAVRGLTVQRGALSTRACGSLPIRIIVHVFHTPGLHVLHTRTRNNLKRHLRPASRWRRA